MVCYFTKNRLTTEQSFLQIVQSSLGVLYHFYGRHNFPPESIVWMALYRFHTKYTLVDSLLMIRRDSVQCTLKRLSLMWNKVLMWTRLSWFAIGTAIFGDVSIQHVEDFVLVSRRSKAYKKRLMPQLKPLDRIMHCAFSEQDEHNIELHLYCQLKFFFSATTLIFGQKAA